LKNVGKYSLLSFLFLCSLPAIYLKTVYREPEELSEQECQSYLHSIDINNSHQLYLSERYVHFLEKSINVTYNVGVFHRAMFSEQLNINRLVDRTTHFHPNKPIFFTRACHREGCLYLSSWAGPADRKKYKKMKKNHFNRPLKLKLIDHTMRLKRT
jgi:hypothetical protein